MYQFKFTLSENDYLEFNKHHLLNAPASKKMLLISRLIVPILFALLALLSLLSNDDSIVVIVKLIIYTLASIVWFFNIKHINMRLLKFNMKLLKKDGKLYYGKDVLFQFNEDFFIETSTDAETKLKYTSIERIEEGKNALYIYIGAIQAYMIPFSVFETTEQKNEFLDFINNKVATAGAEIKT